MSDVPYVGLRPLSRGEINIFFGREKQVDALIDRLAAARFLSVVGPSGCGKSSLVRAGLIDALESGFLAFAGARWQIAEMRPGNQPLRRLAGALLTSSEVPRYDDDVDFLKVALQRSRHSLVDYLHGHPLAHGENLLILVDQFEELFRFAPDTRDEADAFVALLLAATDQTELPVYVVITMRSDYIGDCAQFDGLPEAVNEAQFLTPRLTREQSQLAIEGPARVFGGSLQPELVSHLLNDMGGDPDQLPLMQHSLMRMWNLARTADPDRPVVLTLDHYRQVGGLKHALSNHANEVYDGLSANDQRVAETVFRMLTEHSPDHRDARRPVTWSRAVRIVAEVGGGHGGSASVEHIVKEFSAPGRTFIMPVDFASLEDAMLDISHESLIRQWDRLKSWVSIETEAADVYRELRRPAVRWRDNRGAWWWSKGRLWRGVDLRRALRWREGVSAEWAELYGGDFGTVDRFLRESLYSARLRHLLIGAALLALAVPTIRFVSERAVARYQQQVNDAADQRVARRDIEEDAYGLVLEGQRWSANRDADLAVAFYREAERRDANGVATLVRQGEIALDSQRERERFEAKVLAEQARTLLDSAEQHAAAGNVDSALSLMDKAAQQSSAVEISDEFRSRVCSMGAVRPVDRESARVLQQCDAAVEAGASQALVDRAIARAVLNGDLPGATADLETYAREPLEQSERETVDGWLALLRQSTNPFDRAALDGRRDFAAETTAQTELRSAAHNQYLAGQELAEQGEFVAAVIKYREAQQLDGAYIADLAARHELALDAASERRRVGAANIVQKADFSTQSDVEEAVILYEAASTAFRPESLSAFWWNELCWNGALNGFEKNPTVLRACDQAVALDPQHGGYADSRGVARALNGDREGAIADFERFLSWAPYNGQAPGDIEKRSGWIDALRRGEAPFDAATLVGLKDRVEEDPVLAHYASLRELVEAWSQRPILVNQLRADNERARSSAMDAEEIAARDAQWQAGIFDFAVVEGRACSDEFRDLDDAIPVLSEIFFTDSIGLNACASKRTSDYNQADEEWWMAAKLGLERPKIDYDKSADTKSLAVEFRVHDPEDTAQLLGVVKAVFDANLLSKRAPASVESPSLPERAPVRSLRR